MGLLERLGHQRYVTVGVVLSLVGEGLPGPCPSNHFKRLEEALPTIDVRDIVALVGSG